MIISVKFLELPTPNSRKRIFFKPFMKKWSTFLLGTSCFKQNSSTDLFHMLLRKAELLNEKMEATVVIERNFN